MKNILVALLVVTASLFVGCQDKEIKNPMPGTVWTTAVIAEAQAVLKFADNKSFKLSVIFGGTETENPGKLTYTYSETAPNVVLSAAGDANKLFGTIVGDTMTVKQTNGTLFGEFYKQK